MSQLKLKWYFLEQSFCYKILLPAPILIQWQKIKNISLHFFRLKKMTSKIYFFGTQIFSIWSFKEGCVYIAMKNRSFNPMLGGNFNRDFSSRLKSPDWNLNCNFYITCYVVIYIRVFSSRLNLLHNMGLETPTLHHNVGSSCNLMMIRVFNPMLCSNIYRGVSPD